MSRECKYFFRCIESRFQRLFRTRRETWGDAPGLNEGAPLALKNSVRWHVSSAKGAAFINSLGPSPRIFGNAKSAALQAQFIPEERP
jgi:hypothetical protein